MPISEYNGVRKGHMSIKEVQTVCQEEMEPGRWVQVQ